MADTFLYSLAGGMLLITATGKPAEISWRFLRIIGLLVFAIICILVVSSQVASDSSILPDRDGSFALGIMTGIAAFIVVFVAPFAIRKPVIFRVICGFGGITGLAAGCIAATQLAPDPQTTLTTVMIVVSQLLGALLLGSITISWLLGHAYLTATKMTIAPLRHFSRLLLITVAIRLALLLATVPVAWGFLAESWLIVILRVGVGLIAVGIFSYMVSDCVRLRSTQSATGILYFASLFAYIGELSNAFLIAEYGWPI